MMHKKIKNIQVENSIFKSASMQNSVSPFEAERTKNAYLPVFHFRSHRRIFPQSCVQKNSSAESCEGVLLW